SYLVGHSLRGFRGNQGAFAHAQQKYSRGVDARLFPDNLNRGHDIADLVFKRAGVVDGPIDCLISRRLVAQAYAAALVTEEGYVQFRQFLAIEIEVIESPTAAISSLDIHGQCVGGLYVDYEGVSTWRIGCSQLSKHVIAVVRCKRELGCTGFRRSILHSYGGADLAEQQSRAEFGGCDQREKGNG